MGPGYSGDYGLKDDLLNGKTHIIAAAQNGLTHLNVHANLWCSMDNSKITPKAEEANAFKKVATLYPEANISIIPKCGKARYAGNNGISFTREEIKLFIEDIININQKGPKCPALYFSSEDPYMQLDLIEDILRELIANNEINDPNIKQILM